MAGQLCEQLTSWFFKFASSSCVWCKRRGTLRGLHLVEQVACRDERYIQAHGQSRWQAKAAYTLRVPGQRCDAARRSSQADGTASRPGGGDRRPRLATDGVVKWSGARTGSDVRWGSADRRGSDGQKGREVRQRLASLLDPIAMPCCCRRRSMQQPSGRRLCVQCMLAAV